MAIETSCSACSKSKLEITARAYTRALSLLPQLDATKSPLALLSLTHCTPPSSHRTEADLGWVLQQGRTAIDLTSVPPRMTPTGGESYSKGPVAALHQLVKVLRGRGIPELSVALDVRHPDIFEFIAASAELREINFIILVPRDFRDLVQEDAELLVSEDERTTSLCQQDERWQGAVRVKVESPDLVPCRSDGSCRLYSLNAQAIVGEARDGKLYLKARRIVEALSYISRQLGTTTIAWRE